jgi:F0F1-type ATP synthase membrane subunit c/vacuolar-type H+-ATPase subunit K
MNTAGFIGFAATELVLLLGFVVSMLLLFVAK